MKISIMSIYCITISVWYVAPVHADDVEVDGTVKATAFKGDGTLLTLPSIVTGTRTIETGSTINKGLVVKGMTGQSENLQEWQNSSGTPVASVGPNGDLTIVGNLLLPNTTATTGIIKFGANPFIHNFSKITNTNFFAGLSAGNFTNDAEHNTGIGSRALVTLGRGQFNTAIGSSALYSNDNGRGNTAGGYSALYFNNNSDENTAFGVNALYNHGNGFDNGGNVWNSYNTAIGFSALGSNTPISTTTGIKNTALGAGAGVTATFANANRTGSSNTFIGYNSGPGTSSVINNATAIGANALVSQSDSLVLGASGVKVGIGTASPSSLLDIVGGDIRTNDRDIKLRGAGNDSHGIGWYGNGFGRQFMSTSFAEGPVLYGYNHGALGTTSSTGNIALQWHSDGSVQVTGALSKGSGSFKIDHPLDPKNKYLYHSFVESPDMKNIYDGMVVTDATGYATVELPEWFEALNRDFRYQLTVIGSGDTWARARISKEMEKNSFVIQTDVPGTKVSWQVTGIRKDAYAEAHRIKVEEEKSLNEKGTCLHPEACVE